MAVPKIVLASNNPVKIQATQAAFERMFSGQAFQIQAVSVASGVPNQPASDRETLEGAWNRAHNAALAHPEGDFWVGIEGGVEAQGDQLAAFAWVVILSEEMSGKSRTGTFFLPPRVAELVRQGYELGDADDLVFGKFNSKQKNGAIGILTGNVVDRKKLYEQAVILALAPFKNMELYRADGKATSA